MANLQLRPGETVVGSGMMSLYLKQGLSKKPYQGNIYVTNQRVYFKISMMPGDPDMDLPLEEIKGFSVKKSLFVTLVTIYSISGQSYPLSGFPAKKLRGWLRELGVKEL